MAGVIFAELHVVSGERLESSDLVGVASSPMLSLFKRRRGQLFTVVEPSLPDAEGFCRRLIDAIEDQYFQNPSRSVTTTLRQALSVANEALRSENAKAPPNKQLRVGLSCAAVREGEVYIAQVAPASAFVLHAGSVRRIFSSYSMVSESSGIGGHSSDSLGSRLDAHINFAYSALDDGDLVVLATGNFWKLIPIRYIVEAARHADPERSASELLRCYSAHTSRPTTSLIVIKPGDLPSRLRGNGHRDHGDEKESDGGPASWQPTEAGGSFDEEWPETPPARTLWKSDKASPTTPRPIQFPTERRRPRAGPSRGAKSRGLGEGLRNIFRSVRSKLPSRERRITPLYPPGPALEPVGSPSVTLRHPPPRMRGGRGGAATSVVLVVLFALIAAFLLFLGNTALDAWRSWQATNAATIVQQAQEEMASAAKADSPTAARALLAEAGDLLERALQSKDDQATRALAASVQSDIDRIDRTVRISQASTLVDYSSIVDQKGDVTRIAIDGSNLYVLDDGLNRVYKYSLTPDGRGLQEPGKHPVLLRRGDKVDVGTVGSLLFLTWMPAGQLRTSPALFAIESGRSIVAYDPKTGFSRIEVAESQRWGSVQAIAGFSGALYLLDTKLKTVYYYPPTKNGYESQPYTIVDARARVDLTKAVDIALDGNLYILQSDGVIRKFNREGRSIDFQGDLPDGSPKGARALFANASTRSVYVVDSVGERIIQFSPEGALQRQFRADGKNVAFRDLRAVYVDEASRKLYALAHKSLLLFDLPPMQ